MAHRDAFSTYHPAVNFLYFGIVLLVTMCVMHPVYLAVSLFSALCYGALWDGWKGALLQLWHLLPLALFTAILMPLFCREGATVLFILPGGGALTLESVLHGMGLAGMLMGVLLWFSCYNQVMTTDKMLYLFGRRMPSTALLLTMTMRFIPTCRKQVQTVTEAQQAVGRGVTEGPLKTRLKNAISILTIVVTWALEDAVETADSLKSRGYGLPGRTAFTVYRFQKRDRLLTVWLVFCGAYLLAGVIGGGLRWAYYPTPDFTLTGAYPVSILLVYWLLCLTPVFLHGQEVYAWKRLKSAI